ncbi:MAG: succinyl-diaminopimelate desuccinylase [Deltaproteobacteria bacterium]
MTPPESDLDRTLLGLCEIASFTGEEGPLCDHIEAQCVALVGRDAVTRDGHSLVVCPRGVSAGEGRETVVLAGHLDVVRTSHDGPPRIEDDRLYGPGASDMKSGLAVMLHLLRDVATTPSRFAPVFVFYEREEGPYTENRLGDLLERFELLRTPSLAVCLEPSANVLQLGCAGSVHARVTFHGRTSHSARPWQGENAIHKAAGLLARLSARAPVDHQIDGLLYREVISATMAEGGRGRNVVPDTFTLNLNERFAPGRTVDDAVRDIEQLVGDDAEVTVIDRSPSALPHRSHPLVADLLRAGARAAESKQAWTDVARFAQYGVPAVNLGPGTQSQAHQRNEWTSRADLAAGLALFRTWLFGVV